MSKINYYDEYVIAPGETILELLEAKYMTQLDLASQTGMSKKTINEIIQGKASITTSTALKFEYVFSLPASFWLNLESNYRESLERKKDIEQIKSEEKYLIDIPYNEMAKRNWDYIEKTRSSFEKVINLRKFFAVASLNFDTELKKSLAYRKSENDKFSLNSLYCWLRFGEIEASKEEYPKFSEELLKEKAKIIKTYATKSFSEQLELIKENLKECGVALVFEPHLPNTYINGVAYKLTYDKAIIMLSDRGKKDDILWFTLFHEIAHLIKHSKKEMFIDSENKNETKIEKEADNYAKNILIPNDLYKSFIQNNKEITKDKIITFSKQNKIHPGILLGRLQKDEVLEWNRFNELKINI